MVESLGSGSKLRTALVESLKSASEEDKKIMEESLHNLGIETNEDANCGNTLDKVDAVSNETVVDNEAADKASDTGLEDVIRNLQEAVTDKAKLEAELKSLQEKLAVSDTKVNELTEENNNYKKAIARLATMSKSNKDLKESVTKLEESLKEKDAVIEEQKSRIARLVKSRKESVSESASLTESIETKKSEITTLTEDLNKSKDEVKALTEKLSDSDNKVSELNESLTKATTLKEAYKKLANKAVNKYIDIKATTLGLTSADIKRKLGESYTLDDVDQVCEDLKAYQLNVSKLPFSVDRKVGIRVNESTNNKVVNKSSAFDDDEVDEQLIKIARI
jgi:chromosome segregation ATPase